MESLNQFMESLNQLKISRRKSFLILFLVIVSLTTLFLPIPEPFRRIVNCGLFITSLLVLRSLDFGIGQNLMTICRNFIIILFIYSYVTLLAVSPLFSVVKVIYIIVLLFLATLWISPISPMSLKFKRKTITISDWVLPIFTGIYIVSFEFLNYYIP